MVEECPNCGGSVQQIDDKGTRFACSNCEWMKTPYFEGMTDWATDDAFEGEERIEGEPRVPLQLPKVVTARTSENQQRALKELLRNTEKSQTELADEIGLSHQGQISKAVGIYEYHRANGDFNGKEIPNRIRDLNRHSPSARKRERKGERKSTKPYLKAVEYASENPDATYQQIVDETGYSSVGEVRRAVAKQLDGGFLFKRFSPWEQELLVTLNNGDEPDYNELAEKYGVKVNIVSGRKGAIETHGWLDELDEIPDELDPDRNAVKPEDKPEKLRQPRQEFETELELESDDSFDPTPPRENGRVTVPIDKNTLFKLLVGKKIGEDERREIFDQIVS